MIGKKLDKGYKCPVYCGVKHNHIYVDINSEYNYIDIDLSTDSQSENTDATEPQWLMVWNDEFVGAQPRRSFQAGSVNPHMSSGRSASLRVVVL